MLIMMELVTTAGSNAPQFCQLSAESAKSNVLFLAEMDLEGQYYLLKQWYLIGNAMMVF